MIALLRDPLPPRRLAILAIGVTLAVAFYCLVYTALTGEPESVAEALGWAAANILSWVAAFEAAKRARGWPGVAGALLGGLAASLALGFLIDSGWSRPEFEIWRRAPALLIVAAAAALTRWSGRRQPAGSTELPLLPRQVEWVRAAGNYVELRANGRTVIHRASLGSLEEQLADHGFVRIHRSLLVRRDCIARIRPQDVVLADGTHLKIGKRYRTTLAA
jgi:hypothetical protein